MNADSQIKQIQQTFYTEDVPIVTPPRKGFLQNQGTGKSLFAVLQDVRLWMWLCNAGDEYDLAGLPTIFRPAVRATAERSLSERNQNLQADQARKLLPRSKQSRLWMSLDFDEAQKISMKVQYGPESEPLPKWRMSGLTHEQQLAILQRRNTNSVLEQTNGEP